MAKETSNPQGGSPRDDTAQDESAPQEQQEADDRLRRLEEFDVTAYPSAAAAVGALLALIDPQTPADIERALQIQGVRLALLEAEMLKHAAEQDARAAQREFEEEARDKYGGREESARENPAPVIDPQSALRFLGEILPFCRGPIHQLADDAERATYLVGRVAAGASTAKLMQAAASIGLAIHRIGGESRHRMIHEGRGKASRKDEVADYSQWVRK